jgi:hypothetical protein
MADPSSSPETVAAALERVYQGLAPKYAYLTTLVSAITMYGATEERVAQLEDAINNAQPSNEGERLLHTFIGWAFAGAQPAAAFRLNRPALLLWLGTVGIEVGLSLRGILSLSVDSGGRVRATAIPRALETPQPIDALAAKLGLSFTAPAPPPAVKTGFGVSGAGAKAGAGAGREAPRRRDYNERGGASRRAGPRESRAAPSRAAGSGARSAAEAPASIPTTSFNWASALEAVERLAGAGGGDDPYGCFRSEEPSAETLAAAVLTAVDADGAGEEAAGEKEATGGRTE